MDHSLDTDEWTRGPETDDIELIATIVEPSDGPAECTLYPSVVPRNKLTTTWLTAKKGSFVRLDQAR